MTPNEAWKKITIAKLARDLNLSRVAIYRWKKSERGIPPERAIQVESITGIDRSELRPDLWPAQNV